jgi:hypothetical protein
MLTGLTQSPAKREVWRVVDPPRMNSFLVVFAGKAGKYHEIIEISGRLRLPEPLHHVSPIF